MTGRVGTLLMCVLGVACGGGGDDGGGGVDGTPLGDGGPAGGGGYFPSDAWFYQDISSAPVRTDSDDITAWMEDYTTNVRGSGPYGWGSDTSEMRIDFSITVVNAPNGTAKRSFTLADAFYYEPDCDVAPMPIPPGGAVEQPFGTSVDLTGDAAYDCAGFASGADCHLLVFAPWEDRLYEVYHATIDPGGFQGGCQAIWDTSRVYGNEGRGAGCTSADAAGFPISPLLFRADEVAAGSIAHAIRFILPNEMIHTRHYVVPATHSTNSGGPAESVPYGALFRLRADYPVTTLSTGAQVIARALQRYGMYLADGGQIALTAENDLLLATPWDAVAIDSYALAGLSATDFEIIDTGPRVADDWNCQHEQITQ